MPSAKVGMTMVEVLAATLLSAMLMVAVLGVMRGLKAHERSLELRYPTESWHRSLAFILQQDLNCSHSMAVSQQSIILKGFDKNHWLPQEIRYEVVRQDEKSWLVRTVAPLNDSPLRELVASNVTSVQVFGIETATLLQSSVLTEIPIVDELTFQFLGDEGRPLFEYEFQET